METTTPAPAPTPAPERSRPSALAPAVMAVVALVLAIPAWVMGAFLTLGLSVPSTVEVEQGVTPLSVTAGDSWVIWESEGFVSGCQPTATEASSGAPIALEPAESLLRWGGTAGKWAATWQFTPQTDQVEIHCDNESHLLASPAPGVVGWLAVTWPMFFSVALILVAVALGVVALRRAKASRSAADS